MVYTFDIDVAMEYGVNCAVFISNLQFWIAKNKANGNNFHDGRHWTFNSRSAFAELFPFWTEKQIRTIIDSLLEKGVIVKGNYNESPYDRTCWYAFADESKWIGVNGLTHRPEESAPLAQKGQCTLAQKGQPIPDNKPDNKLTDNKPDISITRRVNSTRNTFVTDLPAVGDVLAGKRKDINDLPRPTRKTVPEDYGLVKFALKDIKYGDYERLLNWFEYNHRERATGKVLRPYCEKMFKQNVDLIKTLSNENWYYAVDCIEGAVNSGYQGFGKADGFFYKAIDLEDYEDTVKFIKGFRVDPWSLPAKFDRFKPLVFDMAEQFYMDWIKNNPGDDHSESEKYLERIRREKNLLQDN